MLSSVDVIAIVMRSEYEAFPQGFTCCERGFGTGVCALAGLSKSGLRLIKESSRLLVEPDEVNERGDSKLSMSSSSQ